MPVAVAKPVWVHSPRGEDLPLSTEIVAKRDLVAPIAPEMRSASLSSPSAIEEILRVPVYAAADVDRANLMVRTWRSVRDFVVGLVEPRRPVVRSPSEGYGAGNDECSGNLCVMIAEWIQYAHAKVNVALYVGTCRPDGYHPVATVIQRLELHDRVEIRVQPRSSGILEISVSADRPEVPSGEQNLAWRAVDLLRPELEAAGYGGARIEIRLEKRIPTAAGLAGGSADAAAVLHGLNRRLGLGIGPGALMERAAELGSDVPACLVGGTLLCTGRGERVRPVSSPRLWWALANPGGELSAGDVYREFDELEQAGARPHRDSTGVGGGDCAAGERVGPR